MTSNNSLWSDVRLRELLTYIEPIIELDDEIEYTTITVKRRHGGLEAREKLLGSQIRTKKQYKLAPGAFIISRIQCWHQAYAIIPDAIAPNIIASTNYDQFVISSEIDKRFFWWLSYSPRFTELVRSCAFGVVIEKMVFNRNTWLDKIISLPPLAEQQRIVARIEELVTKIEKIQGLYQEALETVRALNAATTNALFNLTRVNDWSVVELGDIADIHAGVTLGRNLTGSTTHLPYLRVANVQDGFLDLGNIKETDILPTEFEKWQLKSGDILLTEGGDWDKLGRGAVWHAEIPNCIHQNHIFCVRTNPDDFNPNFLLAVISSPYGKTYFQKAAKQTTNLASINQKQLKAFKVFQPPLSEQDCIVAYLNDLQTKVSMLQSTQTGASTTLDAMLPSILDKAFKGEL